MNGSRFLRGIGLALALSIGGAVAWLVLQGSGIAGALRLLLATLAFLYLLTLLRNSRLRVGRLSLLTIWLLAAVLLWFSAPSLLGYVVVHSALIWLIRSLCLHRSVLAVLLDAGLVAAALSAALWALGSTGSLFAALWCYFLVQALHVAIPGFAPRSKDLSGQFNQRFEKAHGVADAALRRLVIR